MNDRLKLIRSFMAYCRRAAAMVLLISGIAACNDAADAPNDSSGSSAAKQFPLTSVVAGRESLVATAEPHDEALVLLDDAARELLGTVPQGIDAVATEVIKQMPDDVFAVFAVKTAYHDLQDTRPTESPRFLQNIAGSFPADKAGLAAFDLLLVHANHESDEAFLRLAGTAVQEDPQSLKARLALFRRIDYFERERRTREAAMDVLLYWSLFESHVSTAELKPKFAGVLERCGLVLESEILTEADQPGPMAAHFIGDFTTAHDRSIQSFEQQYFADPKAMAAEIQNFDADAMTPFASVTNAARCARVAMVDVTAGTWGPWCDALVRCLEHVTKSPVSDAIERQIMILANDSVLKQVLAVASGKGTSEDRQTRGRAWRELTTRAADIAANLADSDLELRWIRFEQMSADVTRADSIEALNSLANRYNEMGFFELSIRVYDLFLAARPDAPEVAQVMLDQGALFERNQDAHESAVKIYEDIWKRYRGTPQAYVACLRGTVLQIQSEQYESAYVNLQDLLSDPTAPRSTRARALFLNAICEDSLGSSEAAIASMQSLVDDFADDVVAAKALLWLAEHSLIGGQYEEAQSFLLDIKARYPDSEEAKRVAGYLDNLQRYLEKKV